MSDIKAVIALLCKHLRQVVDGRLKPEHFRLAKFNKDADDTVIEFWRILWQICSRAVKKLPGKVLLNDYDDVTFVKLYFAYLQYPVPEFYALPLNCREAGRELLLAFAWLQATEDVLTLAVDAKISNSILAQEFSDDNSSKTATTDQNGSLSTKAELNRIIHISGQISYNAKAISELVSEKLKLATKVHAASINVCGLPHLSVSEMAMVKRLTSNKSVGDDRRMHLLHELASVLDTHAKWQAKQHIFFDWMVTVIEEQKLSLNDTVTSTESDSELSRFVCLLRHIVKKNLHNLKHANETSFDALNRPDCASRLLRTQLNNTELDALLLGAKAQLANEEETTKNKTDRLAIQLKKMLKLIPHCVKI